MRPTTRRLATIAVILPVALLGCGSDDDSGANSDAAQLASYLPEEVSTVGIVDVAALREELDLPADANAAPTDSDELLPLDDPGSTIQTAMRVGYTQYFTAVQVNFDPEGSTPLDGTQIQAAASNFGAAEEPVSIVKTDEPFSDVAERLAADGYEEADGVYERGNKSSGAAGVVADAGDGLVIFADTPETANEIQARIDDEAEPGAAAVRAQSLDGSIRTSFQVGGDTDEGCVVGYGTSQGGDGTSGDLAIEVDGEASADALNLDQISDGIDPGEASTDGSVLMIPFTAEPVVGGLPALQVLENGSLITAYECP